MSDPIRDSLELFADAATTPSIRDNLAQGYDLAAGARIVAHKIEVERVRASEARETGTDRHACYARRIPGTRKIA